MLVVPACCPHFIGEFDIDSIVRITPNNSNCIKNCPPFGRSWTSTSRGTSSACIDGETMLTAEVNAEGLVSGPSTDGPGKRNAAAVVNPEVSPVADVLLVADPCVTLFRFLENERTNS